MSTIEQPRIEFTKLFINNEWVDAISGKTFAVHNPATGEKIADIASAGVEDVNKAVRVSRKAFQSWRVSPTALRSRILNKFADLLEEDATHAAALESLNNGKPFGETSCVDVPITINTFRYYAGYVDKIHGKTLPLDGGYFGYTVNEPVGVVGAIIPWNFPMLMFAWKIAPAIACGNTVVLKPAGLTPVTALYLTSLLSKAGLPAGVLNVLPGSGAVCGDAIVAHPDVDKISFTGSTDVGKHIMRVASDTVKRVTLELGGKSALVIMDDFDVEEALRICTSGIFFNQGQVCCASSRVFVHEKIYDRFVSRAGEFYKARKVGNPLDKDTDQGAQVSETQMKTILSYVEAGKAEGATLVTGGHRIGDRGCFIEPTVFAGVTDNMKIASEEIFGPVMSVLKFDSLEDVIRRANSSIYGLGAGILTNDLQTALTFAGAIRAGTVWINCYNKFHVQAPFGGFKQSGFGRDMSKYAIRAYTEPKAVIAAIPTYTKDIEIIPQ